MKSPDQSIFDHSFKLAQTTGYDPYLFNPPAGTAYPYIQMGSVQIVPKATKSHLIGSAYAVIDVWGDRFNRKKVSDLATMILEQAGGSAKTSEGLQITLDPNNSSIEVMIDTSTNDPLWRARISLTFKFF